MARWYDHPHFGVVRIEKRIYRSYGWKEGTRNLLLIAQYTYDLDTPKYYIISEEEFDKYTVPVAWNEWKSRYHEPDRSEEELIEEKKKSWLSRLLDWLFH